MEQSKQDLLINLYALRTGLSSMYEVYSYDEDIRCDVETKEEELKKLKHKVSSIDGNLKKDKEDLNNYLTDVKTYEACNGGKPFFLFDWKRYWITVSILAGSCLVFAFIIYAILRSWMMFGVAFGSMFGLFVIVRSIYGLIRASIDKKRDHEDYLYEKSTIIPELQEKVDKETRQKEEAVAKCQYARASINEINPKYKKTKEEKYKIINLVQDVLDKKFSNILDPRDWGNVDLIIYYLETNRADTLKEALHLLDQQKNVDMLADLFNESRLVMLKTIKGATEAMQSSLNQTFISMSDSLREECEKQAIVNQELQNHIDDVFSLSVLNSYLISDKSSRQMIENINK